MSGRERTILAVFLACFMGGAYAGELVPGQPAPRFQLPDQDGTVHRLSDYQGRWLVLYFYPKNDTPGCTEEACRFRDDILHLREMGAQVLGASLDNQESHAEFARKFSLQFPLLADIDGKVAASYGSLRNLGIMKLAHRHTFIIDPDGRIAKIYRKVSPKTHSAQVIDDLKELQRGYAAASG
ncbi:MAG: peroxiredoxin [Gammaproteobacteria bacterium]|jgi:peroxiredoxin Q/BCP|nr:peroxiredoxin [Gammaproteobacteria bacterium]